MGVKRFSFPKKERVVTNRDFERAFNDGPVLKDYLMIIRLYPNQLAYSRLGVAISSKRVKKASVRNRLKRLIRESFRLNKEALPKGLDIIVNLKKTEVKIAEITASLVSLLGNVNYKPALEGLLQRLQGTKKK